MELPFLKAKKMAGIIYMKKKDGEPMEPMHEEGKSRPELMSIAEELISAVHMKDAKAVASALEAAIGMCSSEYGEEDAADGE